MDDFWGSVGSFFDGASDWVSGMFNDSADWLSGLFGGEDGKIDWGYDEGEVNSVANTRLARQGGVGFENSASFNTDPTGDFSAQLGQLGGGAEWDGAELGGAGGYDANSLIGGLTKGASGLVGSLLSGNSKTSGLVANMVSGALDSRNQRHAMDEQRRQREAHLQQQAAIDAAKSKEEHERLLAMRAVPNVGTVPAASAAQFGVRFGG